MALGGGTWLTQNKILPGTYINFISAARASANLSERGIATIPIIGDFGELGTMVEVRSADFYKNSLTLFGYEASAPQMKPLRELFRGIRIGYLYRLGTGGTAAKNDFATATHVGVRGNALSVSMAKNIDQPDSFDLSLYLENVLVDRQTVATSADLADNAFVQWNKTADLEVTAGTPLVGGVNPTVTGNDYQKYLDQAEGYSFHVIGCPSDNPAIQGMFTAFTRRMRDDQGVKFQCVTYNPTANSDFEGVVDVMNTVTDAGANAFDLVYWVTGLLAGTAVNRSAMNRLYDGEYTVNADYTQTQIEGAILGGKFALHRVGNADLRVLADINSLTTTTPEKGDDFKQNQTIRVIDQIANDIAVLFSERYMGEAPNDEDGRISLWSDIVSHHQQLQTIRAIENFSGDDVEISRGETKRSVFVQDRITPVNAMEQLYMAVSVA